VPPLLVVRVLIFLVVASLVASWQVAISLLELPVSGAPPEAPKGLRLLVTIPKLGMKDMPTTYTSSRAEV
jgi:hypothetical protein